MKELEKKENFRYDGDIELVECCALCHSKSCETDKLFTYKLGLTYLFECKRCNNCGLRWLSPRPTQKGYEQIYTTANYFGGENSKENYSCVVESRKLLYCKRLEEIHRYVTQIDHPLSLLDIGAATGEFVYEAKSNGYEASGVELSYDARLKAKEKYSIELSDISLEELISKGHRFDVIHMNHVFEHMLDPNACLQQCNSLLKEKGLLVIEVPQQFFNDLDRLKKMIGLAKEPSFNSYSLHHTYFYTPETITLLLQKHDFSICRLRTANIANTPLLPISLKNLLLSMYLTFSDKIHRGGNIIEVFAIKT